MLQGMRNNAKHVLWPLTIVCIIGMGGWGVWYLVRPEETSDDLAGKIWGENVYRDEFSRVASGIYLLSAAAGNAPEERQILASTWRQLLLEGAARRAGVETARSEMVEFIGAIPAFQAGGKFNREIYLRTLSRFELGEASFEEFVAGLIQGEKLLALVAESTVVSPAEVQDFYERVRGKARFQYVLFATADTPAPEAADREQIQQFYQANQATFQVPPTAEISYLLIPFEEKPAAIEAERIEAYYRDNQAEFSEGTGSSAPLTEVSDVIRAQLALSDAWQKANEAAGTIDRNLGEDISLEEAAEEVGREIAQAGPFAEGEEIGELGEAQAIGKEVFRMEVGEISYPIECGQGFVFVRLDRLNDPRLETLEEASPRIVETLREQEQARLTQEKATTALEQMRTLLTQEKLDFSQAAERLGLAVQAPEPVSPEGDEEGSIPENLLAAAFLTPTGTLPPEPIPVEDGFAFFLVDERIPPEPIPTDEKELWEERVLRVKRTVAGEEWLRAMIQKSQLQPTEKFRP